MFNGWDANAVIASFNGVSSVYSRRKPADGQQALRDGFANFLWTLAHS
jgi:hypothetical protein